jgi:hypothetical protein
MPPAAVSASGGGGGATSGGASEASGGADRLRASPAVGVAVVAVGADGGGGGGGGEGCADVAAAVVAVLPLAEWCVSLAPVAAPAGASRPGPAVGALVAGARARSASSPRALPAIGDVVVVPAARVSVGVPACSGWGAAPPVAADRQLGSVAVAERLRPALVGIAGQPVGTVLPASPPPNMPPSVPVAVAAGGAGLPPSAPSRRRESELPTDDDAEAVPSVVVAGVVVMSSVAGVLSGVLSRLPSVVSSVKSASGAPIVLVTPDSRRRRSGPSPALAVALGGAGWGDTLAACAYEVGVGPPGTGAAVSGPAGSSAGGCWAGGCVVGEVSSLVGVSSSVLYAMLHSSSIKVDVVDVLSPVAGDDVSTAVPGALGSVGVASSTGGGSNHGQYGSIASRSTSVTASWSLISPSMADLNSAGSRSAWSAETSARELRPSAHSTVICGGVPCRPTATAVNRVVGGWLRALAVPRRLPDVRVAVACFPVPLLFLAAPPVARLRGAARVR